jgi:hypothetical protein
MVIIKPMGMGDLEQILLHLKAFYDFKSLDRNDRKAGLHTLTV